MTITIRNLEPQDAQDFKNLRIYAMNESPRAFGSSVIDEEQRSIESIKTMFSSQPSFTLGVFDADKLIGLARCECSNRLKTKHKADIFSVFIHSDYRGQGLSRRLLEQLILQAKTIDGLETLLLAVSKHNAPALTLYQSLGFLEWGKEPDALRHAGESISEIYMRLELKK
jgi:ribosomal protein S18 acetylase RimI-like enzyme